jgi:WD40 repeat protein
MILQKLWPQVIGLTLMVFFLLGCGSPRTTSVSATLAATVTPKPPPVRPTSLPSVGTPTPSPPSATSTPSPLLPPTPLPCETHATAMELSASATALSVGDVVTVTVILQNQGCSPLGLPQYRLQAAPPLFDPGRPEPIVHYLAVGPGQSDIAEFVLRAVEAGQATLMAGASFEVHLGYPGPAYWAGSNAPSLAVNVSAADPTSGGMPSQLDLGGAPIRAWAWSPDGQTMALAGAESVYLYSLAAPQNPTELQVAGVDLVEDIAFSPDGWSLATSISSGALQLWDIQGQSRIFALDDDPRVSYYNSLAFSPDGELLAAGGVNTRVSGSNDGILRVIDLPTRAELASFEYYGWVGDVAFSNDGTALAVLIAGTCGRGGGSVFLIDPLTGAQREPTIPDSENGVGVAFSPGTPFGTGGGLLAVGFQQGARCAPDGGYVWLWDLAQGQPLGILPGFGDGVVVTFSPDSALLAASDGRALRLWSLNPMQEVMTIQARFGQMGAAAFAPEPLPGIGSYLLAYQDGETIQLKELPPDLAIRLPPTETPALEVVQPQPSLSNPSKIVFASDNNIYSVGVNTKELTKLAQIDEVLCCPRWSPGRQKIAFAIGWGMHYGVYEMNADGGNLRRLTYTRRNDGEGPPLIPVWSQDGQQVDFVYGNTWFVGEDTSPDGQRIAFVVRAVENDNPVTELYVKNTDGTDVAKLTTPLNIRGIDC